MKAKYCATHLPHMRGLHPTPQRNLYSLTETPIPCEKTPQEVSHRRRECTCVRICIYKLRQLQSVRGSHRLDSIAISEELNNKDMLKYT